MSNALKDWLLSYPPEVREALITKNTGTSLAYVLKRVYLHPDDGTLPTFKAKIAIGLDKASRGQLDFKDMIEDADQIDWNWVAKRLRQPAAKKNLTEPQQVE